MEYEVASKEDLAAMGEFSRTTLEAILDKMGFQATVTPKFRENESTTLILDISGSEDLGLIIGKDGHTLRALQTVLRVLVMKKLNKKAQILLDADNYLLKHEEALKDTAYDALQRVEQTRRLVQLKPMNSLERRIVHMTLANEPNIHTYSIGDGPDRRVVVAPGAAGQVTSGEEQPAVSYQNY